MKQEYEEQAIAAVQDVGRVAQLDYFISTLEERDAPVTEFNEQLWISIAELLHFFRKNFSKPFDKALIFEYNISGTEKVSVWRHVKAVLRLGRLITGTL